MAQVLSTSQQVSFGVGDGRVPLRWTPHFGNCVSTDIAASCFRLYPDVEAIARVSIGDLEYTGRRGQEYKTEYITFNDSDSANTQYTPIAGSVDVDLSFAFDSNGDVLVDISFHHNADTGEIVASAKFTGAIRVEYITAYRIYSYKPYVDRLGTGISSGYYAEYGTLVAFYQGNITTYTIEPPEVTHPQRHTELYRVVSKYITNENGAWEYPDTWPAGTWPDAGAPADGDALSIHERVHEVGYLQLYASGNVQFNKYLARNEQPKVAIPTYSPSYEAKWTGDNILDSSDWSREYASVDLQSIISRLESEYPGISGTDNANSGS